MSAAESSRGSSTLAGIGWMVATTFCFVTVTGIVRYIGTDVAAVEAAFIRYAFGLVIFLPMMRPLLANLPTRRAIATYALRGLVHSAGVMLWFYAMARIPIAEVTALGYTAPIFVAVGAAFFFGEKLHARRIAAVVIGFLGTLLILRPGFHEIGPGQLAQLMAAPMFAMSFLFAKRLTEDEDPLMIVIWLTIFCTLFLLPGAVINWSNPTLSEVFWLAMTAAVATLGHYTMTRAIKAAPLTVTQPISFLQLVWATALGILVFNEAMDPFVLIGGGVIVAAITFISHREAAAARRQITPPAPATRD